MPTIFRGDMKSPTLSISVDEAIEHAGFRRAQLKFLVAAGAVFFTETLTFNLDALVLPTLNCEWDLKKWQTLLLLISGSLAMTIGAFVGGTISDKFGRRRNIVAGHFLLIFFGMMSVYQNNFYVFTILRAFKHLLYPILAPSALCLVLEISPRNTRFVIKMILVISGQLGTVCSSLIASNHLGSLGWRKLTFLLFLPCLIPLGMFIVLDESPRFLILSGRLGAGRKVLKNIFQDNSREDVSETVTGKKEDNRGDYRDMFTPTLKKTSNVLFTVITLKTFVMKTLHTAIPYILQVNIISQLIASVLSSNLLFNL